MRPATCASVASFGPPPPTPGRAEPLAIRVGCAEFDPVGAEVVPGPLLPGSPAERRGTEAVDCGPASLPPADGCDCGPEKTSVPLCSAALALDVTGAAAARDVDKPVLLPFAKPALASSCAEGSEDFAARPLPVEDRTAVGPLVVDAVVAGPDESDVPFDVRAGTPVACRPTEVFAGPLPSTPDFAVELPAALATFTSPACVPTALAWRPVPPVPTFEASACPSCGCPVPVDCRARFPVLPRDGVPDCGVLSAAPVPAPALPSGTVAAAPRVAALAPDDSETFGALAPPAAATLTD